MPQRQVSKRWLTPVATLVLLVLGTSALAVALTLAISGSEATDSSPPTTPPTPDLPSVPVLSGDAPTASTGAVPSSPVAELADPAWVASTAQATGIPERALAAYAGASIAVAGTQPGCGLGWNTLAAIGLVESDHGSIGAAELDADGDTGPPILGVPLDGDGVARIPDTDRGRLDEDKTWDRAVGPMQFIPSTWAEHAVDGNADGSPDVHNLDDAALTAASHLCVSGGDLTQPANWIAAVAAYNPDQGYNNEVAGAATRYAEAVSARG